jgi:hypothetical protein
MIIDNLNRFVPLAATPAGNGAATGPSSAPSGLAVTADAALTDVIDLRQARDIAIGEEVFVVITVTESFATATSVEFLVKGSTDSSIVTGDTTLGSTGAILIAQLVAGSQHVIRLTYPFVAAAGAASVGFRYIGIFADVGGSNATAGKVLVDVILDPQTRHIHYPASVTVV